jgi:hypothetical protein
VLKKAGIIVAATAAGVFAVAPLAFANEGNGQRESQNGDEYNVVQYDASRSCDQANVGGAGISLIGAALGGAIAAPINQLNCNDIVLG